MKKIKFLILFMVIFAMGGLYAAGCAPEETYDEKAPFYEDNFGYSIENGKAIITDYIKTNKHIIIPERLGEYEVTSIGDGAFYEYFDLTTLEIPDSVTSIGRDAFFGCENLSTIEIPDSVTIIGDSAFLGCTSLTTLEIPDSVTSIGDSAFEGCESLITIEIGNSVASIERYAFVDCKSLTKVKIPNSVISIEDAVFANCENLTKIILSEDHPVYSFDEGVLFDKKQNLLHTYLKSNTETSYVIPDWVTSIGDAAFVGCSSLTTVEIPASVTSIGDSAFWGTGLITLEIPDSVTSIGNWAFYTYSLITAKIPDSVVNIGNAAFTKSESDILTITIETDGSYAHEYAIGRGINFVLE